MTKPTKLYIIIVAAGSGNRFGGDLPKQFAVLAGKPVLMRSIEAFDALDCDKEMTVVLSASETERWADMCRQYNFISPKVVTGGATRTESVRNALADLNVAADNNSIVLIHDGARPLVDAATIDAVVSKLMQPGVDAVVPFTPITDSLMTAVADDSEAVDRSKLVAVQTPQGFRAGILLKAYAAMAENAAMTDDASAVSKYAGAKVHLVEGSRRNIKITYPLDLQIAELYLSLSADV